MSFMTQDALRIISPAETAAKGPLNVELMSQLRENIESLLISAYGTGMRLRVDTEPTDENPNTISATVLSEVPRLCRANSMRHYSIIMLNGFATAMKFEVLAHGEINAQGNTGVIFELDSDTALLTLGLTVGDEFTVFYNTNSGSAHTHDGINSPAINVSGYLGYIEGSYKNWTNSGWGEVTNSTITVMKTPDLTAIDTRMKLTSNQGSFYKLNNIELCVYAVAGDYSAMTRDGYIVSHTIPENIYGDMVPFSQDVLGNHEVGLPMTIELPAFDVAALGVPDYVTFKIGIKFRADCAANVRLTTSGMMVYSGQ